MARGPSATFAQWFRSQRDNTVSRYAGSVPPPAKLQVMIHVQAETTTAIPPGGQNGTASCYRQQRDVHHRYRRQQTACAEVRRRRARHRHGW